MKRVLFVVVAALVLLYFFLPSPIPGSANESDVCSGDSCSEFDVTDTMATSAPAPAASAAIATTATETPEAIIEAVIKTAEVVIFSKSYCPFCRRAKKALGDIGITPVVLELDLRSDGRAIQAALLKMTGQRTVPNVFLKQKHFGGSDDTIAGVKAGKFADVKKGEKGIEEEAAPLLKKCGADDGIPCKCSNGKC